MSRRTWTKDYLHITYGNPTITPFRQNLISSMKEVMYFYYSIYILDENKTIFSDHTHDFPKVQNLPDYIDHIVNMEEKDMFLYEDFKHNGFHRKKLYNFVTLKDDFDMDMEYFYKIERLITYVKQSEEEEFKRHEEYTLTVGKNVPNKEHYSDGEPYGEQIFIQYLTKEDLLRLKQTALDFCQVAIDEYNKWLKQDKIKCPKCGEKQLYLDSLIEENEFGTTSFKCIKCKHDFTDDDGIYY